MSTQKTSEDAILEIIARSMVSFAMFEDCSEDQKAQWILEARKKLGQGLYGLVADRDHLCDSRDKLVAKFALCKESHKDWQHKYARRGREMTKLIESMESALTHFASMREQMGLRLDSMQEVYEEASKPTE